MPSPHQRSHGRAFSLIEVVLALGVVSFALVSLMGLVAAALGILRQTTGMNTEKNIMEGLLAEVSGMGFNNVTAYGARFPRYYDEQGQAADGPSPQAAFEVLFSVAATQMPGEDGDNPAARRLVFQAIHLHEAGITNTQSAWIVDNGQ